MNENDEDATVLDNWRRFSFHYSRSVDEGINFEKMYSIWIGLVYIHNIYTFIYTHRIDNGTIEDAVACGTEGMTSRFVLTATKK